MPAGPEIISYLTTYGYVAVFLGAVFEGEVVVILSGLFAQQGYLSFCLVILIVQVAAILNDGMWFLIGRYRQPRRLFEKEWFLKLSERPVNLIDNNQDMLALFMRFMYGFRMLIPLGLGLTRMSAPRFFVLHSIGAFLWAMSLASIGYFFGNILETFFGRIKHPELLMIAVVIVMVAIFLSVNKIFKRYLGKKLG